MEDLQADTDLKNLPGGAEQLEKDLAADLAKLKKMRTKDEEINHKGFRVYLVQGCGFVMHEFKDAADEFAKKQREDARTADEACRRRIKDSTDKQLTGIIRGTFEKKRGTAMTVTDLKAAANGPELPKVDDKTIRRLLKKMDAVTVGSGTVDTTQWLLNAEHKNIRERARKTAVEEAVCRFLEGGSVQLHLLTAISGKVRNAQAQAQATFSDGEIKEAVVRLEMSGIVDKKEQKFILASRSPEYDEHVQAEGKKLKEDIIKLVQARWNNEVSPRLGLRMPMYRCLEHAGWGHSRVITLLSVADTVVIFVRFLRANRTPSFGCVRNRPQKTSLMPPATATLRFQSLFRFSLAPVFASHTMLSTGETWTRPPGNCGLMANHGCSRR